MRGNIKVKINRPIIVGTQPISTIFHLYISAILTCAYPSPGGFLEYHEAMKDVQMYFFNYLHQFLKTTVLPGKG